MVAPFPRPTYKDFTINGVKITKAVKAWEKCVTKEDFTIYAINKLCESKSNMVMFIIDEFKDVKRLIEPKIVGGGWTQTKAAWDLDNPTHETAVASYLLFPSDEPGPDPFDDQVDGSVEVIHPKCSACKSDQGTGPFEECITQVVDCHDFLKGACTNCYYKLNAQKCSFYKDAREAEKKRKREKEGKFKGIPGDMMDDMTEEELRELLHLFNLRKAELQAKKEDDESPRKRHKK